VIASSNVRDSRLHATDETPAQRIRETHVTQRSRAAPIARRERHCQRSPGRDVSVRRRSFVAFTLLASAEHRLSKPGVNDRPTSDGPRVSIEAPRALSINKE
jgi:hypothetical protein